VELALEPDDQTLAQLPTGETDRYGTLLGSSEAMRRLYALLERLEGSLVPVLISGESGTGKEVVARLLHERSMVGKGPFVAVNCGVLDRTLVRSELFGHARGAFTGAVENRAGVFEAAAKGTLFLDEIGELPLEVQPVLLRVLETGTVQRVGETIERPAKVRLIAATNRKLDQLVKDGKFREDLYYRLLVVHLELPPLRDRAADIPALVRQFATEQGAHAIDDAVIAQFVTRGWPGNVRELKNAVRAFAALGSLSQPSQVPDAALDTALRESIDLGKPYAELKEQLLERFQRVYLELLLTHTGGNQSEAARLSGLERSHLNKVLKRLG
jgi:DNA-binding NtrC family response regulator